MCQNRDSSAARENPWSRTEILLHQWKTPCQSRWIPEGDPWEACTRAGSCQDIWPCGGSVGTGAVWARRITPMEWTHTGAICEEQQPERRIHPGKVHRRLSPVGGTPPMGGITHRSPHPKEEGVAETRCDELIRTPIPHPSVLQGEEEVEKRRLSLGRREWCVMIIFFSHYPTLNYLISRETNFSKSSLFCCENNWWVISLCPYLPIFSLYCPAEEGSDGAVWWAPDIQPGSTHNMECGLISTSPFYYPGSCWYGNCLAFPVTAAECFWNTKSILKWQRDFSIQF